MPPVQIMIKTSYEFRKIRKCIQPPASSDTPPILREKEFVSSGLCRVRVRVDFLGGQVEVNSNSWNANSPILDIFDELRLAQHYN